MGGDGHKVRESLNSAHEALVAAMSIIIDRSWLRDSLETLDQSEALLSEAEEQLEQRFCDEAMKENDTWGCFVYPDRNHLRDDRMVGTHKTLESCRTAAKALIHKHRDEWPNADYGVRTELSWQRKTARMRRNADVTLRATPGSTAPPKARTTPAREEDACPSTLLRRGSSGDTDQG